MAFAIIANLTHPLIPRLKQGTLVGFASRGYATAGGLKFNNPKRHCEEGNARRGNLMFSVGCICLVDVSVWPLGILLA